MQRANLWLPSRWENKLFTLGNWAVTDHCCWNDVNTAKDGRGRLNRHGFHCNCTDDYFVYFLKILWRICVHCLTSLVVLRWECDFVSRSSQIKNVCNCNFLICTQSVTLCSSDIGERVPETAACICACTRDESDDGPILTMMRDVVEEDTP